MDQHHPPGQEKASAILKAVMGSIFAALFLMLAFRGIHKDLWISVFCVVFALYSLTKGFVPAYLLFRGRPPASPDRTINGNSRA